MDLNYVRRFSAYVGTFYHSEYITSTVASFRCVGFKFRNPTFVLENGVMVTKATITTTVFYLPICSISTVYPPAAGDVCRYVFLLYNM